MGKRAHKKKSRISVYDGHPGCLWGIMLPVVEDHHWGYVKKRLPHWKYGGNKQARGDGNSENNKPSDAFKLQETGSVEVNNSNVEENVRQATQDNKKSVKSQIKALVGEESAKRNGRHYRTSTYPVRSRLTRTDSIHRLEPSYEDFLAEISSDDASPGIVNERNGNSNATGSMDLLLPKSFDEPIADEETHKDCQVMVTLNVLGHNQIDENETQLEENHMPPQENVDDSKEALLEINRKELVTDTSLYRSEEFPNALDIINLNKEYFVKVLHDPSSPLAHYFHNQQTLSARMGLTKSESFPLPSLSGRRTRGPSKLKQKQKIEQGKSQAGVQAQNSIEHESLEDTYKQSMPSTVEYRADGIRLLNQLMAETADCSSGSAHGLQNHARNQVVIKRFKDLRQKIKHAIRVSKNEGQRIALDAVLHKIPRGQGFSTDLKKETFDQFRDPFIKNDGKDNPTSGYESNHPALSGKSELYCIRRASSLSEKLNRYGQLYESSFNRETQQRISGGLKLRGEEPASSYRSTPKSLGRILSLPELRSYFYQSEDPSDAFPSSMLVRAPVEETSSISSFGEQNSTDLPIASEYCLQLDTQENLIEVRETDTVTGDQVGTTLVQCSNAGAKVGKLGDDLSNLTTTDNTSNDERDIEPVTAKLAEPSPVSVLDFNFQEIEESAAEFKISEESEIKIGYHLLPGEQDSLTGHQYEPSMDAHIVACSSDYEKVEIPSKHIHFDIPHFEVDTKDKAKFDYVKNVLELSGFSGNEFLGTWHSDYQPVDPSVYDEVEGCIFLDPDCCGNEGGNCNHMLLFDLINEVLMDIYERSYSYCPMPLSSLSRIHPMPAGYHVLKEVWENISWYLSFRPELDQSLNYITTRDLANDGWMNLQFDAECVGLEVEDLIFEDLLDEVMF